MSKFLSLLVCCCLIPWASADTTGASKPPWGYEDESSYLLTTPLSTQFGEGELSSPMGTLILDKAVVVADCGNHRLVWFNLAGKQLRSVGSRGEGEGQFNCPTRMASDGEKLYVVDAGNHRVHILNQKGESLEIIDGFHFPSDVAVAAGKLWVADRSGVHHYQLQNLKQAQWLYKNESSKSIAVDEAGQLYLLSDNNHQVQVVSPSGALKKRFGEFGKRKLNFAYPSAIRYYQGALYIADQGNHRYQVTNTEGEFLKAWGEHPPHNHLDGKHIHFPEQMSVTAQGMVDCDPYQGICQYDSPEQIQQWQAVNHGWQRPPNYSPLNTLASAGDIVAVTDTIDNKVQFFALQGGALKPIGEFESTEAHILAFNKNSLLLRETGGITAFTFNNKKLQRQWQKSFSELQKSAAQKKCSLGSIDKVVAANAETYILVDSSNHQLLVSDAKLSIKSCWGKRGTALGELNQPTDALVWNNSLYVLERLNHRLQKISIEASNQELRFAASAISSTDVSLILPSSLALSDNRLVVADRQLGYATFDANLKGQGRWNTIQSRAELKLPGQQLGTTATGEVIALTAGHHVAEVLSNGFVYYELGVGEFSRFDYFTSEWQAETIPPLELQ